MAALKVTGANAAWARNYGREFSDWIKHNGFDRMPAPTRSVAIELHENAEAIDAWRSTLPERRRKRPVHPLSNVRAWRQSSGQVRPPEKEYAGDLQGDDLMHWR